MACWSRSSAFVVGPGATLAGECRHSVCSPDQSSSQCWQQTHLLKDSVNVTMKYPVVCDGNRRDKTLVNAEMLLFAPMWEWMLWAMSRNEMDFLLFKDIYRITVRAYFFTSVHVNVYKPNNRNLASVFTFDNFNCVPCIWQRTDNLLITVKSSS